MITGDHVVTASAIARQLGIMEPGDRAVTGVQVDAMNDRELDQAVPGIAVYAAFLRKTKSVLSKAGSV